MRHRRRQRTVPRGATDEPIAESGQRKLRGSFSGPTRPRGPREARDEPSSRPEAAIRPFRASFKCRVVETSRVESPSLGGDGDGGRRHRLGCCLRQTVGVRLKLFIESIEEREIERNGRSKPSRGDPVVVRLRKRVATERRSRARARLSRADPGARNHREASAITSLSEGSPDSCYVYPPTDKEDENP